MPSGLLSRRSAVRWSAYIPLEGGSRDEAIADCTAAAVERAVMAGANPATVEVVDVEEVPLTYVPSNATRVRVKAVGDIAPNRLRRS